MGSVLGIFVENMKRLLANSNFKVIPVVISHEIIESIARKYLGEFPKEPLKKNAAGVRLTFEYFFNIIEHKMFED